jgi:hypothetical protein
MRSWIKGRGWIAAAIAVGALGLGACGDDEATPDFTAADLESVSFAPEEVAGMEYQPQRSGAGAFTRGDEHREIAERLEGLGLEANFVSQFFATSRRSELGFVESVAFLFEDEGAATEAVDPLKEEYLDFLDRSEEIDAPEDLGEQRFGVRGAFEGFTTFAFAWRAGDVIQIATVAPNGQNPGPESTIELAQELVSQAD